MLRFLDRYEERSLGIFEAPLGDMQEDLEKLPSRERIGRYFNWHLRRQLSIGLSLSKELFNVLTSWARTRHLVVSMGHLHRRDH
jgi:hypothetical protein